MVGILGGKMTEFQKSKLKHGKILYILRLWFDQTVLPDIQHSLAPISGKKPKAAAKPKAKTASAKVTEKPHSGPDKAGKDARADNIGGSRHSLTMVTSLWGNGECGPLTIVLPVGFLKDEEVSKLQQQFAPDVYFLSSGRSSHFMNAEVVVQFFDSVLGDAFEKRRTRLAERWAWLSRGMASKEDMIPVNPDIDLNCDGLTEEMKHCEESAASNEWQAPLEEVFTLPDVSRTAFLWQIALEDEDITNEDWEGDEEQWRCMPSQWQALLNTRLADFQAKISDAEALWKARQQEFGDDDIKTKNSKVKLDAIRNGEGADSVILICKGTGKEASSDVYARSVNKIKGVCKIATSSRVQAYKLNVQNMQLIEFLPEVEVHKCRRLRIISVTGRSREIQELRVHLSTLSLCTSGVLSDLNLPEKKQSKQSATEQADQESKEKDVEMQGDDVDAELALVAVDEVVGEAAEGALEAAMTNDEMNMEAMESESGQPGDGPLGEDGEESLESDLDNAPVWEFGSGDAFFVSPGPESTSSTCEPSPKGTKAPSCTFKDMPSFTFLENLGLTEIPAVQGCGLGVHSTISCWQLRYPADSGPQSAARSWGNIKKRGFVSPCKALLQCLHWAWESHAALNPTCEYSKGRVQLLKGAILADLGRDVKH
eukprot:Skav210977  [mRNA]  locus=scaffold712:63115:72325:- [translate_table: standard]